MRPSRLSIILILIVVLVIGVGVIGWIYATPRPAMSDANDAAAPKAIEYTQEELSAQVAHDAVASWVSHCMKVPSFHSLPEEYIAMFNVHNYLPYLTPAAITHPVTVDPNLISQQQQEVVSISKILYIQRSVLDKSVSNMAKWSIELQWVIIAIGLSTTAVVAINAIDIWKIDTVFGKMIRILAVVLPAVGTAAAAMAALYPRDEVARTNVIIGSLGQLHGQIAVEVWGLQCDSTPSDDPKSPWKKNAEVIEKWMARKEQILNPARSNPAGSGATEAKSLPTGASQQPAAPK